MGWRQRIWRYLQNLYISQREPHPGQRSPSRSPDESPRDVRRLQHPPPGRGPDASEDTNSRGLSRPGGSKQALHDLKSLATVSKQKFLEAASDYKQQNPNYLQQD